MGIFNDNSIFDALKPGAVIVHSDEEQNVLWVWHGGHTVNITDAETGQDWDCFNWMDKPRDVAQAVEWAQRRAKTLREEIAAEMAEEDDEWADEEYDGQPDEAQEWYDFDPDC
jgi:hypothetical protein